MACADGGGSAGTAHCDYKAGWGFSVDFYPSSPAEQYFGRGPIQLSWNYNYGAFSKALVESTYDSKMFLLENPSEAASNGYVAFTAGLWFWMTP